ncbi:MAG: hypothetical protein JSW04_09670 [Desulfobacterales bacterium]|nr:MAG: hypothetical protein JSW04_09670 [Desulfobacterales bacterium]
MRKLGVLIALFLVFGLAPGVFGAEFAFHGDMNHRFAYTNHNEWIKGSDQQGLLQNGSVNDFFGEIKYRLWFEAATNEKNVKGVFATEIGGLRFGERGSAEFSGDQIRMEVRWAYVDFQCPWSDNKNRFKVGLQPFKVNPYLWSETVAGINLDGAVGNIDYQLAWQRGYEVDVSTKEDGESDVDSFLARIFTKPTDGMKAGVFALYQTYDDDDDDPADFSPITSRGYQIKKFTQRNEAPDNRNPPSIDILTLGVDGSYAKNNFFVNWDVMYQTGDIEDIAFDDTEFSGVVQSGAFDLSAYFAHFDLGYKMGKAKFTYTFWYASGDDNPNDRDFDAFITTDIDRADSISIMEGNYADDNYFTEDVSLLDKGLILNKLALDYSATDKTTVGAAILYMLTAEDIQYTDNSGRSQKEDEIGIEVSGYMKYMLYKNLEFAVNAGYLFAGDAMDAFEVDEIKNGSSDEDIFIASSRIRYKF